MAKYTARHSDLQSQADTFQKIGKTLAAFEGRLNSIVNAMDSRDNSMATLKTQVRNCAKAAPTSAKKVTALGTTLSESHRLYKKAETDTYITFENDYTAQIFNLPFTVNEHVYKNFPEIFIGGATTAQALSVLFKKEGWQGLFQGLSEEAWDIEFAGSAEFKTKPIKPTKKDANIVGDGVTDVERIASIGIEGKKEVSMFDYTLEGEYGKVSAKIGTAEAHGGLYAGMYAIGEDGEKFFSPGVSAEIGASVCALSLLADGSIGSDLFGGYGKASVDVGKVEAKGEAAIGFHDKDGNFSPTAKVSASAKAVAAEAKGSAGVTVLGTDIGVKGSVNVGIGAHLDVGFDNGKFSFDVGASLGIGASVGFEVDIGGTVNAIAGAAESAWQGVTDAWGGFKNWAGW